jgi:hypothetical protein
MFNRQAFQSQQGLAFLPCAPGCRGSESDPRHCQCVCRGINHGILLYPRPVQPVPVPHGFNPSYPLLQAPEVPRLPEYRDMTKEEKREAIAKLPEVRLYHATGKIAKKIGRNFAKSMLGIRPSETELNEAIMNGLRKQFSEERVNAIIDESFSEHYSRLPDSNRPELYELYESGYVDNVLDRRGIRWVIGRPKRK